MLATLKKIPILWEIFRIFSSEYQPPFGSVGHSVQTGFITEAEAATYLDRTDKHEGIK